MSLAQLQPQLVFIISMWCWVWNKYLIKWSKKGNFAWPYNHLCKERTGMHAATCDRVVLVSLEGEAGWIHLIKQGRGGEPNLFDFGLVSGINFDKQFFRGWHYLIWLNDFFYTFPKEAHLQWLNETKCFLLCSWLLKWM